MLQWRAIPLLALRDSAPGPAAGFSAEWTAFCRVKPAGQHTAQGITMDAVTGGPGRTVVVGAGTVAAGSVCA